MHGVCRPIYHVLVLIWIGSLALGGAASANRLTISARLSNRFPVRAPSSERLPMYIGGSVGQSFVEHDFGDTREDEDFEFDDDEIAYRIFLGFRPIRYFALEGGWRDFGTPDDSVADVTEVGSDISAWDVFGVVLLPIGPLDLFGKAGVGFWDAAFSSGNFEMDETGEDFMWGAGAALWLGRYGARLEWEQLETDFPDTLGVLSLGFVIMY